MVGFAKPIEVPIIDLCPGAEGQLRGDSPLSAERIQNRDCISDVIRTTIREDVLTKPFFPSFLCENVHAQQLATGYGPMSLPELLNQAGNAPEELCFLIHVSVNGLRVPVSQTQNKVTAGHSPTFTPHP